MANQEHLAHMRQGRNVWDIWRMHHPDIQADLSEADLRGADLFQANLRGAHLFKVNLRGADLRGAKLDNINLAEANLSGANLFKSNISEAILSEAILSNADIYETNLSGADLNGADLSRADLQFSNLSRADLSGADLSGANLSGANLSGANLCEANLCGANLRLANLCGADLSGADLSRAILVNTILTNATLKDCRVYGISVWDAQLDGTSQINLTITPEDQPTITVDNLKIAQFIYLLLNNVEIRHVINTLTTKTVLILGRFSEKRKPVLIAIQEELRNQDLLPILFDFDRPSSQTVREAVRTLAQLSYFIIADLTEQSSIAEELEIIIPQLAIPVKPLLDVSQKREFSMFKSYGVYDWVLPIYKYADISDLLINLQEQIIEPAKQKALEWTEKKRQIEPV